MTHKASPPLAPGLRFNQAMQRMDRELESKGLLPQVSSGPDEGQSVREYEVRGLEISLKMPISFLSLLWTSSRH